MPGYAPIACLVLIAALPTLAVAQDADEWSIEESRAPSTTPLRFTATEGTWISLDVSPDGQGPTDSHLIGVIEVTGT
ncbi:MAG: hypothetical protein F4068_14335 [Gemmatimonadetes bacterium]|nr:hypothetical protein [Gemmatimonadota bacterium]MYJ39976.1 hypothetical protein [Gemmatimonadota bacterium]